MYKKLAGMTGTADTEAVEFHQIYDLEVMVIPTHKDMIRDDLADRTGQTGRRAVSVAVLDPLGVLPAERRERDDAGVEPRVADLRDPLHLLPTCLAMDRHVVDPGAVQLLELVEPPHRSLFELVARADHGDGPAAAGVDRQRQPEVALARDVPVAHVAEPVVHPLPVLQRRPLDLLVRVQERLPQLVAADEPVVDDAEDERRLAAPADRVPVHDPALGDEQAAVAERFRHARLHLGRGEAGELAVGRGHPPRLVDRREHRQAVHARELEVLGARARRDVDDAGALLERDLVPRDHAVRDVLLRR